MTFRRAFKSSIALFRGRRLDEELQAEIAAHLELAEKEAAEAGLTPEEARRTAHLRLGGVERIREDHRDDRSARWMETFWRDIRYGFASIVRDPGFAAVSIGVLALGIGANTAMFSLVDATLLRPLPFPHPERLARIWETPRPDTVNDVNTLDFIDWKRLNTVFDALTAETDESRALTGAGEPVRLDCRLVSAEYFDVFGVPAAYGRTFAPGEDDEAAAPVVVLGHAAWQTYFGGNPEILGHAIMLNRVQYTVVGILPAGVFDLLNADVFLPLVFSPDQRNRDFHWLTLSGRLKPGITFGQAQQEMSALDVRLSELSPAWKRDWGVMVEPYDKRLLDGNVKRSISVTFGAVALVLLIACANVTNLMLAKGATRRKEMAVRAALGASRLRLTGQLLAESLVLCGLGGAASIGLAKVMIEAAKPALADSLPFRAAIDLDGRVLIFTAAATLMVSFAIGLLPAFQTSFARLSESINRNARGLTGASDRLRRTIVVGEVAVSLALICGALLLFKSLLKLQRVDPGVQVENVLRMPVDLPKAQYPTPESAVRFYDHVVEQLSSVPGVEGASVATDLPMEGVPHGEGLSASGSDAFIPVRYKRIDSQYFELLDIPILAGRGLEARDRADAPLTVVINEQLAARIREEFGIEEPVGRHVSLPLINYQMSDGMGSDFQIVGVARSERIKGPGEDTPPVAYVSLAQVPRGHFKIIVRGGGPPASLMAGVRQAIGRVDPGLAVGEVRTLEQVRARSLSGARQPAWLIGVFALAAAFLAALGLYGVLSQMVTQQRREIGIRMALGARSGDVMSRILGNGARMIAVGSILGLAGAFATTRVMENLLFEVSALDPAALITACAATVLVGLAAALLPARRAARVTPMTVLREET